MVRILATHTGTPTPWGVTEWYDTHKTQNIYKWLQTEYNTFAFPMMNYGLMEINRASVVCVCLCVCAAN